MENRWITRKDAIILAIDIGKNSLQRDSDGKTYFEKSIYCASMILKRKLLTESEDHLALILFGSSHTINHLSSQGNCYGNIETVACLDEPTWDLYNCVKSLSPTQITPSDWISTFVLAADMLRNQTKNKYYTGLQIVMFSKLTTDISFDNIDVIASCLKMENIHLTIVGKDYESISLFPASNVFIKKTEATAVNFDSVLPKISYYKQKEVTAKSWNALLTYRKAIDIKVFGYETIDITTKSSNWLFSKSYDTEDLTTANKDSDENSEQMEVDNELPIDDFYSNNEIIPLIDLDTDECSYIVSAQRCLQVLGFVKTTKTQRSFLMDGGSFIFKPHKTDIIAFNAIFDSMVEKEEVMLVRKIDLYMNLLNIGALLPQKEKDVKFFEYVNLPSYAEKNYLYKLPSIDPIKSHLKTKISPKYPNAMDLDIDGNKFAMPEHKYDVGLQVFYDSVIKQILKKIIPEENQYGINPRNPPKNIMETAEQHIKDFEGFSIKQEVFENSSDEDNYTIQFGHNDELYVSNKLRNPTKSVMENAEPYLKDYLNRFTLKQEFFENSPAEDNNTVHFGYDEEVDVSNELINPAKSFIENAEPPLNEFKKEFSIKQEVFENWSVEDNNTIHFGYDEELDVSDECISPPKSFIENAETPLNEFKKEFSIKQEVFENCPAEDNNSIHFGYDEEVDVSSEYINPPKSFIENAETPLNEFKKEFSIKQEVFENCPAEDNNSIHFGYDEEVDVSNEYINPPKSFIENAEPPLNEFIKTFSIKQEVFENCSAEDNNSIHFGYDEGVDISNEYIDPPKSFIENAEPPLNEFIKTFSIKQEFSENFFVEDNSTTKVAWDEELDVSKQCVITPLNPIEDFNKLLKNGFDSAKVCKKMQYVILNLIEFSTSLEDLMKPIATLKAFREYYIINNDAESYNNYMHLVKDTVLASGKENMWSTFINSGIGLITNAEVEASDISEESSEEFKKQSGDFDIDFINDDDNSLKEYS